jgi:AcrR family transcriptional regulator
VTRVWDHRTGAKGRQRSEEILDAAAELFTARGYAQTTALEIADAVGLTKASLYYYVASKDELLFRVLLRNHRELHRHVTEGLEDASLDDLERVATFVARHVGFVLAHRDASSLYADEVRVVRSVEPWWDELVDERRRHEHSLKRLITDAIAAGLAASELDATLSARALLGMANAPVRWYHGDGRHHPERIAEQIAELARRSLRP